jgi:curved DNA-binding protein CbpA
MVGTMSATTDLYKVLQVDQEAERDVIRAAYVCLAKRYHPDAGSGSSDRMVALNEAWAVLGDSARRAAYDAARRTTPVPQPAEAGRSPAGEARTVYAPPPRKGAPGGSESSTMDFGRYVGWPLEALAREDPDYLEWLARMPIGRKYRTEIHGLLGAQASAATRAAARPSPRQASGWRLPWQARA